MARKVCNGCDGEYDDVLRDGSLYFHVCPPLSPHEIRARIAAGQSPLTPAQTKALAAQDAIAAPLGIDGPDHPAGDAYLAGLALARAGHRDENVDVAKVAALRNPDTLALPKNLPADALMKKPGAGALVVAAAAEADAP